MIRIITGIGIITVMIIFWLLLWMGYHGFRGFAY